MPRPPHSLSMTESTRPVLVAITGGTSSGKSTIAGRLAERLQALSPAVLHQDHYFRSWSPEEADRRTANAPEAVRWDVLRSDLVRLAAGIPVETPPRRGREGPDPALRSPGKVVLVEGHLLLWEEAVRNLFDLKVYLDVPDEERIIRRLLRDTGRGADLATVAAWLRRDVLPNHWRYTAPARGWADLLLPANPVSAAGFEALAVAIEHLAAPPGRTPPPTSPAASAAGAGEGSARQ